ncbi:hypothetical protein Nepgr_003388 [Nepenthes gracilis]|uniref:Uncharacterized protein n=1 Tax=Nepenthes gracilis TaxID=150966 RepID=A0AAD3RZI8_NEPGR|nr:hypothetical protein Nepgr_003388 [Nepenthes gracilis]
MKCSPRAGSRGIAHFTSWALAAECGWPPEARRKVEPHGLRFWMSASEDGGEDASEKGCDEPLGSIEASRGLRIEGG